MYKKPTIKRWMRAVTDALFIVILAYLLILLLSPTHLGRMSGRIVNGFNETYIKK
jgi:hypothetical protein